MKTTIFAIATMMMGSAAMAQTTTTTTTNSQMDHSTHSEAAVQSNVGTNDFNAASWTSGPGPVIMPSNANPERDMRGIAVISAPAVVPAGWNGSTGTAMGGPLVDANTGEVMNPADETYPACTAQITDNCVQAYTRY